MAGAYATRVCRSMMIFLGAAVASCARKPAPASNDAQPIAPVVAELRDAQPAVPEVAVDACRSMKELLESDESYSSLMAIKPPIDLDGDGKPDPVFRTPGTPYVSLLLFIERDGCVRELGSVTYTESGSYKVLGRDKAGWAILYGHIVKTGQEGEERAEYDGTRYVTKSRGRLYHPSFGTGVGYWEPWSSWSAKEQ